MRALQVAARGLTLSHFVLPLMRQLRKAGAIVEALCGNDGFGDRIAKEGFTVHTAPLSHTLHPLRWLRARRFLARFLSEHPYDVIHTHGSFVGIAANDVILRYAPVLLYTQHGFYVHEGLNPLRRWLWLGIERRGLRHAHKVICVSQAERDFALTLGIGGPDKFIAIPGAGVETARFHRSAEARRETRNRLRAELKLAEGECVLLTVSRLTWDKGYAEIIDAARQLRSSGDAFRMVCAGSGRDEAEIRAAICQAGLNEYVTLLGWRDDVVDLYCMADVFVFASHREGLPISPIEAMAAGLPVVLSDLPGCREILGDSKSGLLFPARNASALAAALRRLLSDSSLRTDLALQAVERARHFDISKVLDLQLELYREVTGMS